MDIKYIKFGRRVPSDSGKTMIWQVLADGRMRSAPTYSLGEIRWHGAWRRYVFHPFSYTIYEKDCLRKLADFCENQTKKLQATWKKRKKNAD